MIDADAPLIVQLEEHVPPDAGGMKAGAELPGQEVNDQVYETRSPLESEAEAPVCVCVTPAVRPCAGPGLAVGGTC